VQTLVVIDSIQELANGGVRFGQVAIFLAVVEWRGAFFSPALSQNRT
jgi:hypothetical protein